MKLSALLFAAAAAVGMATENSCPSPTPITCPQCPQCPSSPTTPVGSGSSGVIITPPGPNDLCANRCPGLNSLTALSGGFYDFTDAGITVSGVPLFPTTAIDVTDPAQSYRPIQSQPGIYAGVFDLNGAPTAFQYFNTYGSPTDQDALTNFLLNQLVVAPPNNGTISSQTQVVVLTVNDDATFSLDQAHRQAISQLTGATQLTGLQYRGSYVLVSVNGVAVLEQAAAPDQGGVFAQACFDPRSTNGLSNPFIGILPGAPNLPWGFCDALSPVGLGLIISDFSAGFSQGNTASITSNGLREIATPLRGLHAVVYRGCDYYTKARGYFDTYADPLASANLINFLDVNTTTGDVLALSCADECSSLLSTDARTKIANEFGATQIQAVGYRNSYSLIARKSVGVLAEERTTEFCVPSFVEACIVQETQYCTGTEGFTVGGQTFSSGSASSKSSSGSEGSVSAGGAAGIGIASALGGAGIALGARALMGHGGHIGGAGHGALAAGGQAGLL